MNKQTLKKLKERGLQTRIAEHFDITSQAVNLWIQAGRIPAERVLGVEAVTGISRADLRPDMFSTGSAQ